MNVPIAGAFPLLQVVDDTGDVQTIVPADFGDQVAYFTPQLGVGFGIRNGPGMQWSASNTMTGAVPVIGAPARIDRYFRGRITSGSSLNASSGFLCRPPDGADDGVVSVARGFFVEAAFSLRNAELAGSQAWAGPYGQPLLIQDVALSAPNKVGFGWTHLQPVDNWYLYHAAGAGNATPIDTGIPRDNDGIMRVRIAALGSEWVALELSDLNAGLTFSALLEDDIPGDERSILEFVQGIAATGEGTFNDVLYAVLVCR